jgi:hypothetical protein
MDVGTKYRSPYNVLTVHTFGICRLRQMPLLGLGLELAKGLEPPTL